MLLGGGRDWATIINKMLRKSITEKVAFEWRTAGGEIAIPESRRGVLYVERRVNAKTAKHDYLDLFMSKREANLVKIGDNDRR